MTQIEAIEFGFVNALPKREKSRWQRVRDEFERIRVITDEKGMLVPVHLAAALSGVCKQRIHQLMEVGKLERVDVLGDGHPFVTERSLMQWADSERKAGRPLEFGKLTLAETVKRTVAANLAVRKDGKK